MKYLLNTLKNFTKLTFFKNIWSKKFTDIYNIFNIGKCHFDTILNKNPMIKNYDDNIFLCCVFNNKYIRWEEINNKSTVFDLQKLIIQKYDLSIKEILVEINDELVTHHFHEVKLTSYCDEKNSHVNALSVRIITKDKNMVIKKSET